MPLGRAQHPETDAESDEPEAGPRFKFNCQSTTQANGYRKGHKLKLSNTELNFQINYLIEKRKL